MDLRVAAGHPPVDVLHGGDAGGEHLEGGIEGVEFVVDPLGGDPRGEPEFQGVVGRAELQGGEPDMVMAVDEARQHHVARVAMHGRVRCLATQGRRIAHLDDDAVPHQHGGVVVDDRGMPVLHARDDSASLDDDLGHADP